MNSSNQIVFLLTKSCLQLFTTLPCPITTLFGLGWKRGQTMGTGGWGVLPRLTYPSVPCHTITKDLRTQPPEEQWKMPCSSFLPMIGKTFFSIYSSPSPGKGALLKYYHNFPSKYYLNNSIKRIKYRRLN